MDDLISKRAAVSRISDLLMLELKGQRIPTWNEVYNAIGDIPPVHAVPLDKLCEWLGGEGIFPPCCFDDACDDCKKGPYWERRKSECWKQCLTKWMEEQEITT